MSAKDLAAKRTCDIDRVILTASIHDENLMTLMQQRSKPFFISSQETRFIQHRDDDGQCLQNI